MLAQTGKPPRTRPTALSSPVPKVIRSHADQQFAEFGFDFLLGQRVERGGHLLEKEFAPALTQFENACLERGDGDAGDDGGFFRARGLVDEGPARGVKGLGESGRADCSY